MAVRSRNSGLLLRHAFALFGGAASSQARAARNNSGLSGFAFLAHDARLASFLLSTIPRAGNSFGAFCPVVGGCALPQPVLALIPTQCDFSMSLPIFV